MFGCALAGYAEYIVSDDARMLAVEQYQEIRTLAPVAFWVLVTQKI